ncbi:hypothetical protein NQZ79_g6241 [Umbelopsis isabellina]|nr:hypothetical protein NQZ79_g6241 [Umbelopsis isabellina]
MKDAAKCDRARGIKRSTLACLSCRSVRQKCNGEPPEGLLDQHSIASMRDSPVKSLQPCDRCILNKHECLWNQSRRFGRPRKTQRIASVQSGRASPAYSSSTVRIDYRSSSASNSIANAETSSSQSPTDHKAPSQMYGAQNFIADENYINMSDVLSLMQTDVDTLSLLEQGQIIPEDSSFTTLGESTWVPNMDQGTLHINESAAPKQTREHISSGDNALNSLAALTSLNSSAFLFSGEGIGEEKIEKIDEIILQGFQQYVDLSLDPPPMISGGIPQIQKVFLEPLETRSLGEKSLYLAMAAAGYRMAGENFTLADSLFEESFTLIQSYLSSSDRGSPDIIGAVDAMYAIQACSVLAPYAYGTRNALKAEELLLGVAQLAIRRGLHQLDSPEPNNDQHFFRAQTTELQTRLGERTGCSCQQLESCAACFTEALRQTWWELYVCNAIFWSSTSKAGPNEGSILSLQSSIKAPKGLDLKNSLANGIWKLRIRCAAILVESLSVERAQCGAAKARLQALDTMVSNLQKALRGSDHSLTIENENKNRTRLHNMIIASEIMLYGAQIHLHRLRWVPTFNLKLRGCSFNVLNKADKSEGSLDVGSRTSEHQSFINELENETEYESARQSLATIHSCANKIFKLIPNEAEEGCEKVGQKHNSLTADLPIMTFYRWPYFACVQVIAAFGQLIGLTAHRRSVCCRPSILHIPELTVGICMDSQCTPDELIAFPHKGEDKTMPVKWLRLEACSNLQLAESMLLCMEATWPFAENCKDEVEACRTTIAARVTTCGEAVGDNGEGELWPLVPVEKSSSISLDRVNSDLLSTACLAERVRYHYVFAFSDM